MISLAVALGSESGSEKTHTFILNFKPFFQKQNNLKMLSAANLWLSSKYFKLDQDNLIM